MLVLAQLLVSLSPVVSSGSHIPIRISRPTYAPIPDNTHNLIFAGYRRHAIRKAHVLIYATLGLPLARPRTSNAVQQHGAPSGGKVQAHGMFRNSVEIGPWTVCNANIASPAGIEVHRVCSGRGDGNVAEVWSNTGAQCFGIKLDGGSDDYGGIVDARMEFFTRRGRRVCCQVVGCGGGEFETMNWERLLMLLKSDNLVMHGGNVTQHSMQGY